MSKFVILNKYVRDAQRLYVPADMVEEEFVKFQEAAFMDEVDEKYGDEYGYGDAPDIREFVCIVEAENEKDAIAKCPGWNKLLLEAIQIQ